MTSSTEPSAVLIVSLDHPSLEHAIARFAEDLRDEPRYFGRAASPKPFPSLIRRLTTHEGLGLGAMIDGRLVGVARVDDDGTMSLAVVLDWRGRGVGTQLLQATIDRAERLGHSRLVMQSSRRSRPVHALGATIGATVVDIGGGRVDLIFGGRQGERSA